MAYIYKIYNDFDNKVYIGKTSRDVQLRFLEHYRNTGHCNSYINHDMAKKGIQHFKYEILEECPIELLSEREKYWIKYFHSYIKDPLCKGGYNLTPGGDGISLSDDQIEQIVTLYQSGKTIIEISKEMNLSHSTVYHRIKELSFFNQKENKKRANQKYWRPIDQYTEDGQYIKTFESIASAAKEINIENGGQIVAAIKSSTICHGFRWTYKGESLIIKPSNKKQVQQLDKETEQVIAMFDGAREAARKMNVDPAGIMRACSGKQKTCKGYKWRYV